VAHGNGDGRRAETRLKLSVLDQSPIPEGATGYHRFWVAEHHGTPGLACTSPEVLIGPIAAATARLRVGSGGVMLPHYSPLKVAENFSLLCGLYPGRIDLGVGRAAGTDPGTARALQRDRRRLPPDDFPNQLSELLGYFDRRRGPDHGLHARAQLPGAPHGPEIWLLGSSPQSAIWAAELGLPYAFADFINPQGAPFAAHYRTTFTPGPGLDAPRLAVAAWAVCAPTQEEAEDLAASFRMMITLLHRGELIAVPPVEKARRFLAREGTAALARQRRIVVGTPDVVRAGLEEVAAEYAAEEVLVVTIVYDHAARRRSYELIAGAFGLVSDSAPAGAFPAIREAAACVSPG
jgi:luciferase family oxidoreductase group 1